MVRISLKFKQIWMQKKRFGEKQIIAILREAENDEKPIGDVCHSHGIAENPFSLCHCMAWDAFRCEGQQVIKSECGASGEREA